MKLLRYGPIGIEKPGIIDHAGEIRDLSEHIPEINGEMLSPINLARIRSLDPDRLAPVPGRPRLGPCVGQVSKIIAVGLNYANHAKETGSPTPKEPILFMKATTSLCGPADPIQRPRNSRKTDWEIELGVVIGRLARYVTMEESLRCVAGYCVVNDVSEREFQIERGGQWTKGKSCDTFCPLGPWLVTTDEIPDPQNLELYCEINGEMRQRSTTGDMIFSVAHLVSYISQFMTLLPGDVIASGTPAGVGLGMKPPLFLKAGDKMRCGVAGLGEQQHDII